MGVEVSQRIAQEMIARFPIDAPAVPYTGTTDGHSFDVGIPFFRVSLNKAAPEDQIGRYDSQVNVKTNEALAGFQGGAYYRFMDERGNVVYAMMGDIYGVNGTLVPGAPSEVQKQENKNIPLHILTAVHSVQAIPVRLEGPALDNIKRLVAELASGAEAIKDDLKKLGANLAEIAAAIKAF